MKCFKTCQSHGKAREISFLNVDKINLRLPMVCEEVVSVCLITLLLPFPEETLPRVSLYTYGCARARLKVRQTTANRPPKVLIQENRRNEVIQRNARSHFASSFSRKSAFHGNFRSVKIFILSQIHIFSYT